MPGTKPALPRPQPTEQQADLPQPAEKQDEMMVFPARIDRQVEDVATAPIAGLATVQDEVNKLVVAGLPLTVLGSDCAVAAPWPATAGPELDRELDSIDGTSVSSYNYVGSEGSLHRAK